MGRTQKDRKRGGRRIPVWVRVEKEPRRLGGRTPRMVEWRKHQDQKYKPSIYKIMGGSSDRNG